MSKNQNGIFVLLASLVAVVLAVLTYFMLIQPQLDEASIAHEDAEFARQENDIIELQIQQMQAKEKNVPNWQEEIAKISIDMPPTVEQAPFERLLSSTFDQFGLPVVSVLYGQPTVVDPTTSADFTPPTLGDEEEGEAEPSPSPTPQPDDDASQDDASEDDAKPEAPATPETPVAPFTGLWGIPVTVTTEGDHAAILDFLKSMNSQLDRYYTVTNVTVAKATPAEEAPGRPALTDDQWTVEISGLIFVLEDAMRSIVVDEEGMNPEYVIGSNPPNAFEPLPGLEASTE